MINNIKISGFSDEISSKFEEQLKHVTKLGMNYISLRGINGKNINEYTIDEIEANVVPLLNKYNVSISSIGSPIGKIYISDENAFHKQKEDLHRLCQIANILKCDYIRVFSFYISKDDDPDKHVEQVINKLRVLASIAKQYNVVLLHENEKDIYGDTDIRCHNILKNVDQDSFKGIFDFANFVQCGVNPLEAYVLLKEYIEYIHIKDALYDINENVVCGTGDGKIYEILKMKIEQGYSGFLTLEPHLVMFDSLKDLELEEAADVIKVNKAKDGAEGYKMQYEALLTILKKIEGEI